MGSLMVQLASREKRIALRLPVHVAGDALDGTPFTDRTTTVNVSGGGICFDSVRPLPVGARVELRIQVPPPLRRHFGGRAVYAVKGVVCRMQPAEQGALHRIGARFLGTLDD